MFTDPAAYERFMGRWSRLVAPLLLEFAGIENGWLVFDLGSGTGSLANEIAARRPHCRIVGIDSSPEYVAYAKARLRGGNVHLEVASAQALPFMDAKFHASLSLLVLNFISQPEKTLAELRRVTRPRGRICAATWDYGDGMEMLRLFWDTAIELDPGAARDTEKYIRLCRSGELSGLWAGQELASIEEQPLEITMHFESFEDYWQPFLWGQGPSGAYLTRLAPELRIALRDQLKQRLPGAAKGAAFELRGRAWAVRGTVLDCRSK